MRSGILKCAREIESDDGEIESQYGAEIDGDGLGLTRRFLAVVLYCGFVIFYVVDIDCFITLLSALVLRRIRLVLPLLLQTRKQ